MKDTIRQKLIDLNQVFYSQYADSFSSTRERLQPGVISISAGFPMNASILDLGCGNGLFLFNLAKMRFQGYYCGLDFSEALLMTARDRNANIRGCHFDYVLGDITNFGLSDKVNARTYDLITAFAALHHIPGADFHQQFFEQTFGLLNPGGKLILSLWQFKNSERLVKRIQPWDSIGLSDVDVEEGDTLLDWRAGKDNQPLGLRYVHLFSEIELSALAEKSHFKLASQFYSDGKQGNLALYQEWEKPLS